MPWPRPEEGLWQIEAPVPEIGPDDVLIRVRTTGICGTDSYLELGRLGEITVPVPMITGHEFAGEIVDMGRNVSGLTLGQDAPARGILSKPTAINAGG